MSKKNQSRWEKLTAKLAPGFYAAGEFCRTGWEVAQLFATGAAAFYFINQYLNADGALWKVVVGGILAAHVVVEIVHLTHKSKVNKEA